MDGIGYDNNTWLDRQRMERAMIKFFNEKNPLIFFPKKWANAVSRWLMGVYSPSGTIKITNTANPDEHGSLGLDVNIDAVIRKMEKKLHSRRFSESERLQIRDTIRAYIDGVSIYWKDKRFAVNEKWLNSMIHGILKGDSENGELSYDSYVDKNYTDESDGYVDSSTWVWANGGNGLKMDVYCEVVSMEDGTHGLQKATLTFSPDGRLTGVEKQEGCKYITA
jgi:hypothetical protein